MIARRASLLVVVGLALAVPAVSAGGKVVLTDALPRDEATQVAVTVHEAAAFGVVLRTSKQGRTRLFLLGKTAPSGGALIDTKTYACVGTAGAFACTGKYDPLPAGTYTFRIVVSGPTPKPAPVTLTVSW